MSNNKPAISFSFISLFLLVSAVAVTAGNEVEPVKDANGNPLKSQTQYFIQPVSDKKGGGLVPANIDFSQVCPLGVAQNPLPFQPGLPVTLSDPSSQKGTLSTNTDLIIEFQTPIWFCVSSKIWKVDTSSSSSHKHYVTTGGSSRTRESFFRIQKYGNDQNTYKLVQYQSSSAIKVIGSTPGLYDAPTLVLKDDADEKNAFPVKFREVDTSTENIFVKSGLRMFPSF
ncbi:unnamed protein product [Thlaspi arvense]|uniref:Uncharacterized protein n=1 Tax=Thlaspi arvense TaxID=13288 RepID=A0AAU9R8E6_THLAR|nr:unnamed protein product [Thlaspi arvense]